MRTTVPSPMYVDLLFRDFQRMTKEEKLQRIILLWYGWPNMCMAIREKLAEVDREKIKEEHRERNRQRHRRLASAVKQASAAVVAAAVESDEHQTESAAGSRSLAVAPAVDSEEYETESAAGSHSLAELASLAGLHDLRLASLTADAQEAGNLKKRSRQV